MGWAAEFATSIIIDRRSARRRDMFRPGRGNGDQPNKETSFHMPIVDFAELDAHNS